MSYLVANPEDRFSHDVAHIIKIKTKYCICGSYNMSKKVGKTFSTKQFILENRSNCAVFRHFTFKKKNKLFQGRVKKIKVASETVNT